MALEHTKKKIHRKFQKKTQNLPEQSQVSVTNRKSNLLEQKKLFKIKVLLARDLAFSTAILVGTADEGKVDCRAQTSCVRFVESDPHLPKTGNTAAENGPAMRNRPHLLPHRNWAVLHRIDEVPGQEIY